MSSGLGHLVICEVHVLYGGGCIVVLMKCSLQLMLRCTGLVVLGSSGSLEVQ
jgi:hypothetical protein